VAGRPRKATIVADTFFPRKGDILEIPSEDLDLQCVRTDLYVGEEIRVRYGLLLGHVDGEGWMPVGCVEDERATWLGSTLERQQGGGVQAIRRIRADGCERRYEYDSESDAYIFLPGPA